MFKARNIIYFCIAVFFNINSAFSQQMYFDNMKEQGVFVFCYHDIIENDNEVISPDSVPIFLGQLKEDFEWLKTNGYTVVSIENVIEAKKGNKILPNKSVLITFDDGYRSFYKHVLPLAEEYEYPILLSLQTGWLQGDENGFVKYGVNKLSRNLFLSDEELKKLGESEYISFASHTNRMHEGILANPQGCFKPAAITFKYNPETKTYETIDEYTKRITDDLLLSKKIIKEKTGKDPVAVTWPFGHNTKLGAKIATELGMVVNFSLSVDTDYSSIWNPISNPSSTLTRHLIERRHTISSMKSSLHNDLNPKQRIMHVDLDYIYSPNEIEQERNLATLLARIKKIKPTAVYLQAYADEDGNGTADSLYFPNSHLPMKADLFNRVSWKIFSDARVPVYAWMPVLGFEFADKSMDIVALDNKTSSIYRRLSPFNEKARKTIKEIYSDLSRNSFFLGILYHDDGVIGDFEDVSPAGLAWLENQDLPTDITKIHRNPIYMQKFTKAKTAELIKFTNELTEVIKVWNPRLKTARNIYALPILNEKSEEWYANNFDDFIANYDYTAVMAMPYMENAKNPKAWLKKLIEIVNKNPLSYKKALFELQTVDWANGNRKIDSKELAEQMQILQSSGINHYGYYPDDFVLGHPIEAEIIPYFSTSNNQLIKR